MATMSSSITRAAVTQLPFGYASILILTVWIAGASLWATVLPASYWLTVRSVYVSNTVVGEAPAMLVDRTIKRPFLGRWVATVMKRQKDGVGFSVYCVASGQSNYTPAAAIPDDVTLDWWTWPRKCQLPVGEYQVRTTWYLQPSGHSAREVENVSNTFRVFTR